MHVSTPDRERNYDLAKILAAGFVDTYVEQKHPDRAAAITYPRHIFQQAYGYRLTAGQEYLAQKLVKLFGNRTQVDAQELQNLASKLGQVPPRD